MSATDAFRQEHAALIEHVDQLRDVARRAPEMGAAERREAVRRLLDFLRGHLVPHAEAEERVLYPAVAELLGNPAATATMISDHRAIVSRIDALEEASADDVARLQELLYGLHALLVVHFHKEEDDYLPLLEERPDEEVAAIFERMAKENPQPYRLPPPQRLEARPGVNLDKALQLAGELEDAETIRKLRLGK